MKKTELAVEDGKIVIKMSCSECNTAKTVPVPEDENWDWRSKHKTP